ncbi:Cuticle protein AM1274 [Amphibalanus amphitrite]|uniref:Cuticle protein AM1274 n=1 Tax=Amphibalanus amphitrite TaxID=1232801 RepID=A0A6A4W9N0_AMPAM|nr:cuticle protein AMP4-like [Amphibalanus amphitrite]KAF0298788.1 Cuticle protein AM1274 [Amphibalanus amphitrite]
MKLLIILLAVAACRAAPRPEKLDELEARHPDFDAQILEQINQHTEDGGYSQLFRTENGIVQEEQGQSYPGAEPGTGSYVKQGVIEYPLDDGSILVLNYVADENGYAVLNPEALSQALPTPPPTQYPPPQVPGAGVPVPQPLPEYNPFLGQQ